jgi:hypothetical protein
MLPIVPRGTIDRDTDIVWGLELCVVSLVGLGLLF